MARVLLSFLILMEPPMGIVGVSQSGPTVRLESIDGSSRRGQLIEIDSAGRIRFRSEDAEQQDSLGDISSISVIESDGRPMAPALDEPRALVVLEESRLLGRILPAPEDRKGMIRIATGLGEPLEMPLEALAAVRFGHLSQETAEKEFLARLAERPADKDLLIVVRNDRTTVLPVALERLDARGCDFTMGSRRQRAPLDSLYAVILARAPAPPARSPALVRLADDQYIAGRIVKADRLTVHLDAGRPGRIEVPWAGVESIELRSGRLVRLSDLRPVKTLSRSMLDIAWPPRINRSVSGGPLSLRGRTFEHGLGMHAYAAMTFRLDRQYERFKAMIGVDDRVSPHGSVVFRVLLDGRVAFESPVVRGDQPAIAVSVDLTGVSEMVLECDPAEELDIADHADWAGAALIRARSGTVR